MNSWLSSDWLMLVSKLTVLAVILYYISRQALPARRLTLIWRLSWVLMLSVPLLHGHWSVIQLDWLPATQSIDLPPVFITMMPTIQSEPTQPSWWLLWPMVSIIFLIGWSIRLFKLYRLSQQAIMAQPDQLRLLHTLTQDMQLNRTIQLKISDQVRSPCTWGVFKPVILVPNEAITPVQWRAVLLHELAHIKRFDWLWSMTIQLTTALCWINPFLWWIKRQHINSMESACDEWVLSQSIKPSDYAQTLLQFHQTNQTSHTLMAVMMAQPSPLFTRLQTILNPQQRRKTMTQFQQHLITASAISLMALTGFTQLTHATPTSPEAPLAAPFPAPVPHADIQPAPQAPLHPQPPVHQHVPEPAPIYPVDKEQLEARIHAEVETRRAQQPQLTNEKLHEVRTRAEREARRAVAQHEHAQQRRVHQANRVEAVEKREAEKRVRAAQRVNQQHKLQLDKHTERLERKEFALLRAAERAAEANQTLQQADLATLQAAEQRLLAAERQLQNQQHKIQELELALKRSEQALQEQASQQ